MPRDLSGATEIIIDEKYLQPGMINAAIATIFHEYDHCHLKNDHDDTMIQHNHIEAPKSIRHSILMPNLNLFWDEYMTELFTGDSSALENAMIARYDELRSMDGFSAYSGYFVLGGSQNSLFMLPENKGFSFQFSTPSSHTVVIYSTASGESIFDYSGTVNYEIRSWRLSKGSATQLPTLKGAADASDITLDPNTKSVYTQYATLTPGKVTMTEVLKSYLSNLFASY